MSRIAYVNGRWLDQRLASVNIEDRGYQFGDGIYEVVHVYRGRFVDEERHLARLDRSLREIRLPEPMPRAALLQVMRGAGAPEPGRRGPALHAGDARRRPARPRLPARGRCRRRW